MKSLTSGGLKADGRLDQPTTLANSSDQSKIRTIVTREPDKTMIFSSLIRGVRGSTLYVTSSEQTLMDDLVTGLQ